MRAAVITRPGSVELATVEDPAPGPREVVVEVAATGLCGTDLHILQGEFAPKLPIIPGHEFAGEVVGRGSEVTELALGDQVAVDPSLYCFECHYCRLGHNNLCERWAAIGVTHPGAAAEYAVALASRVLVYGAGTMGLMMLQLAKATGAASVDVVDINAERLATAWQLGCTAGSASADELDRPPYGWDLVVDATGNAKAIQDALGRVGKCGTYLQFGVADYATRATIEPYRIYNQEITITGSMAVLHQAGIGRKIQIQPGLATA